MLHRHVYGVFRAQQTLDHQNAADSLFPWWNHFSTLFFHFFVNFSSFMPIETWIEKKWSHWVQRKESWWAMYKNKLSSSRINKLERGKYYLTTFVDRNVRNLYRVIIFCCGFENQRLVSIWRKRFHILVIQKKGDSVKAAFTKRREFNSRRG